MHTLGMEPNLAVAKWHCVWASCSWVTVKLDVEGVIATARDVGCIPNMQCASSTTGYSIHVVIVHVRLSVVVRGMTSYEMPHHMLWVAS